MPRTHERREGRDSLHVPKIRLWSSSDSGVGLELSPEGNTGVELKLPYNTPYNVTVVATHPCGLNNVTTSIALYFGEHCQFART